MLACPFPPSINQPIYDQEGLSGLSECVQEVDLQLADCKRQAFIVRLGIDWNCRNRKATLTVE